MLGDIEAAREFIKAGVTRDELRLVMPPGGGRNAVDCALWELEAARTGQSAWALAGVAAPRPLLTTFTLGADEPEAMARGALAYADARAIKVKLTGDLPLDIARVAAVRAARPDIWLGVDGNQGFKREDLIELIDALLASGVKLLEQPLARGREADLEVRIRDRICRDESLCRWPTGERAGRFDSSYQLVKWRPDRGAGMAKKPRSGFK